MIATITISTAAARRMRAGYPWVRRQDVAGHPTVEGAVVYLSDERGKFLGTALWSPDSPLAARLWAREQVSFDEASLGRRMEAALARRRALFPAADAFRMVHGEADLLPGLFVDCYQDVAVIQTAAAAMDAQEPLLANLLQQRFGFRLVVARNDGAVRDFENLPRRKGILAGTGSTTVRFHDAGALCESDVLEDAKTGSFLDQQENHRCAATYARAGMQALDAFTFHGGFALALARQGAQVVAIDESPVAIERSRANAKLNDLSIEFECANAFDRLRAFEAAGRLFDLVVIDPPALAKRRSALPAAERGYKELNLRALRLLRPGGILVSCSCSGRLTPERFGAVLEEAAGDVGHPVELLERRGAGRDHPPLLGVPETEYLKCWIMRTTAP